jgi:hypothetical protein
VALSVLVREGDDLDGTFATGAYASKVFGDSGYFGIRRVPYSVDFTKNAFTFIDIVRGQPLPVGPPVLDFGDNAEAHNAGEIWTTMMFEGYVALLKTTPSSTRTFDEVRRAMSNYVVVGLQLTPPDATYTEQRDAIIAAASAQNQADAILLSQAFARRGAGTCAVSPARNSTDFAGVVESFVVAPKLSLGKIIVDESQSNCDFAGELHIPIQNGGAGDMLNTTVQISTTTTGVSFPNGNTVVLSNIPAFSAQDAVFGVALASTLPAGTVVNISVAATNADSCATTVTTNFSRRTNVEFTPNASASDDVEADQTSWTPTGNSPTDVWQQVALSAVAHEWQGADLDHLTDTALESPSLQVGTGALSVTFQHSFKFERSQGKNFDGGILEVSTNGGAFVDVSTFVNPGYNGAITTASDNPLGGRQAFINQNAAFPAKNTITLNFGTQLANQTIKLRFRTATDSAVGNIGWAIDNIAFQGITNTPFGTVTVNSCSSVRACNDSIDNDGDGLVDFPNDPGCSNLFDNDESNLFACNDNIDNDGDGFVDFPSDFGCINATDNNESNLFACNDGIDNDADGLADFPNDPGCINATDNDEFNLFTCNDGVDNDGDGLVDFPNDPGCAGAIDNDEFNVFACNDSIDNDGDGLVDFPNDPGCANVTDNNEFNLFACNDGVDNDGDGLADFPNDLGCQSANDNDEIDLPDCSDGFDNDNDGVIDFPNDPGCVDANDLDETDPPLCADGVDNDSDGFVDFPNDPGCQGLTDNDEANFFACNDGVDNDGDNLIDFPTDPGCQSPQDNNELNAAPLCADGVDNDFDGFVDFPNDPGCADANDNDEFNLFACNDGQDNEGDGFIDFPNDPGCQSAQDNDEFNFFACNDGVDNDNDGASDFPNDPGCQSTQDDDETNSPASVCSDGQDNDNDGLTDFPTDPGCVDANDNDEANNPTPVCSDGIDNDNDSLTDFPADPGCVNANDNDETNNPASACSDGADNDGDNLIDFPSDPGCVNANDNDETNIVPPACSDGVDNDSDGATDFPADLGCADANDNDEFNAAVPTEFSGGDCAVSSPQGSSTWMVFLGAFFGFILMRRRPR